MAEVTAIKTFTSTEDKLVCCANKIATLGVVVTAALGLNGHFRKLYIGIQSDTEFAPFHMPLLGSKLNFLENVITCASYLFLGYKYEGLRYEKGNCGVSIMRSGKL